MHTKGKIVGIVGCEESQEVTKAFRERGHEMYSCDLKVKPNLGIFHPPCTHIAVSGAKHFKQKREDGRQQAAIDFFLKLANVDVEYSVLENPVGIMSTVWRKSDQIIQPYYFGDPFTKTTCLWLRGSAKIGFD